MPFEFLLALALILFFAGVLHGSIGFGFPMIATPLLALFTDIQTAIIFTLIPTLLVNITSILSEEKFLVVVKQFLPFALIAMVGSALGTSLLIVANSDAFKLLLAATILVYLLINKLKIQSHFVAHNPKKSLIIFGLGSGILGGLTNVMAPVLIIYSLESKHTKTQTIQFSNLCFLLGKIIQIVIFSFYGAFSMQEITISFYTLFVVGLALYIGIKLKKRIDAQLYNIFIKLLLFVIAVLLLYQVFA